MQKKTAKPRVYIRLTAWWGNDDAESTIKISRRRWQSIQEGAEYWTSAWGWYEGSRFSVAWSFADGLVSVTAEDRDCICAGSVGDLVVETITPD